MNFHITFPNKYCLKSTLIYLIFAMQIFYYISMKSVENHYLVLPLGWGGSSAEWEGGRFPSVCSGKGSLLPPIPQPRPAPGKKVCKQSVSKPQTN